LDIKMPQMDGYEVCATLKAAVETREIPVIFLSGLDSTPDKVKAFAVGGADFIPKPFQAEEVLARINNQLTIQWQRQQLKEQNHRLQQEIQERQRVETALRQQAEREQLIAAIAQRIRQSLNLKEILDTAVAEVQQLLQVDRVLILRFCPHSNVDAIAESISSKQLSSLDWIKQNICGGNHWQESYQDKQLRVIEDITTGPSQSSQCKLLTDLQVRAQLAVPILQGEEVWGVLLAHHCTAPRAWATWELELLQQLADQMAIAIQQANLYQHLQATNQDLQRLAIVDSLTGIANRRRFDEYLQQEWQRLWRDQIPLSLILCDIDYFKHYNDYYGHQAGDDCLRQVAQAIARSVRRSTDLVARYGGEEFAVVLPNTNAEGAVRVAEYIQMALASLQLPHGCSPISDSVTLSMGIASTIPTQAWSPENLIAAGDEALYAAKAEGRNIYRLSNTLSVCSLPNSVTR
jgi:diguanylate cyclase (GGDEF)-like protein